MRKYGRVDSNHGEVADALRKIGCSVESIAPIGGGCPDLLVGYHGDNYVMEVKRKGGKLTEDEELWQREWRGNCVTVDSPQAAINYVLASGR